MLLAVFIYWGWESAVNLSEESRDSSRGPGLAGMASTVILLVTYVLVAVAIIAYLGLGRVEVFDDNARILAIAGNAALGSDLGKVLVVAVIISGISSAQTTILPGSRTSLSMAAAGALPKAFASDPPALPDPRLRHDRGRRPGGALVRARPADLRELPLRLALGAVADDRVLLRAHRLRLRDLLAPGAHRLGEELPLHRRRAAGRRRDALLPAVRVGQGPERPRRPPTRAARYSGSACRW